MKKTLFIVLSLFIFTFCSRQKEVDELFKQSLNADNHQISKTLWKKIVTIAPESDKGLFCQAALLDTSDFALQSELIEKAIEINPEFAEAYNFKGNLLFNKQKYELALKNYTLATEFQKNYADAYYNRGNTYRAMMKLNEAIEDYNRAIGIDSSLTEPYINKGLALQIQGNYHEALSQFYKALSLDSNRAEIYLNLGIIKGQLRDFDASLQYLQKAIKIDIHYGKAYYNLGITYYYMGSIDEACKNWKISRDEGYISPDLDPMIADKCR